MQLEVSSDKDYEAINTFRAKILEGKVPGVTNPDDAYKYIRKGKLTYQQALNLCKPGTIESLTYDAATGFVCCSFALGISFLTTYVICFTQTGNKKESELMTKRIKNTRILTYIQKHRMKQKTKTIGNNKLTC